MRWLAAAVALLALAAGGCGGAAAADGRVLVTIEHSRFDLEREHFAPGEHVTFVIRNLDPIDHEFILGDEETQAIHEEGAGHHHGDVPGEISVPAGEERETSYTFGRPGTLIVGCHLPGHYDYGMRAAVRVRT